MLDYEKGDLFVDSRYPSKTSPLAGYRSGIKEYFFRFADKIRRMIKA